MVLVWLSPSTSPVGKAGTDPTAVWEDTNHAPVLTLKPLPVHGSGDLNMTFPGGGQQSKMVLKRYPTNPTKQGHGCVCPHPSPLPSPLPAIQPSSGEPLLPTHFYTSQY